MNNKVTFFKSLRFRLTITYSTILFVFAGVFVLSLNIYLNDYLQKDPRGLINREIIQNAIEKLPNPGPKMMAFSELSEEERERIREVRLKDLREVQTLSVISLLPLAVLSFAMGYYVSGKFLSPLTNLQKEIELASAVDLGRQIEITSDDEIGSLIKSYNEMSIRLKSSFDSQTQFVQDASHELRTPLTIIKTNLDTVMDNPKATNTDLKDAIKSSQKGIEQMKKLSDYLLDLVLPGKLMKENTNIIELTNNQTMQLKEIADKENVRLEVHSSGKEIIEKVDKIAFGRAMTNIIENGIKYSKGSKDAKVTISIKRLKQQTQINISDNGIGIPEEHLGRIFERFYRVDKSRNSKTGGFGLGLSIVKTIIDQHGGTITVTSVPGNTTFTIVI